MNDRSSSSSSSNSSRLGIQKTKQIKRNHSIHPNHHNNNNDSDNQKAAHSNNNNINHGLHPGVTIPPSLRRSHLLGCEILEQLQPLSPDLQTAVLQSYAHTLQSEAGMKKLQKGHISSKDEDGGDDASEGDALRVRRQMLFQRAMEKVTSPTYVNPRRGRPVMQDDSHKMLQGGDNAGSSRNGKGNTNPNKNHAIQENDDDTKETNTNNNEPNTGNSSSSRNNRNNNPSMIVLPVCKLKLMGSALKMYGLLSREQQGKAREWCDDAAMHSIQNGKSIRDPTAFLIATLRKFIAIQSSQKQNQIMPTTVHEIQHLQKNDDATEEKNTNNEPNIGHSRSSRNSTRGQLSKTTCSASQTTTTTTTASKDSRNRKDIPPQSHPPVAAAAVPDNSTRNDNRNNNPSIVVLPVCKLKLMGSALEIYRLLSREQQEKAREWCDDAAIHLIQNHKHIRDPTAFLTATLRHFVGKQSQKKSNQVPNTEVPSSNMKQKPLQGPLLPLGSHDNRRQQTNNTAIATSTSNTLPTTTTTVALTPTNTASLANSLQATGSRNNHGNKEGKLFVLPRRSSDEIAIAQLRQELASTKDNLETKSNHCHDLMLKVSNLTKMRDMEAHNNNTGKDRVRQLEDTIVHLNETFQSKDTLLATHLQQCQTLEQESRDMSKLVNKLTQELCFVQEEKRELSQTLQTEREHLKAKELELQKVRAALKRSEMLRPSNKNASSSKQLVSLRRELQETQEKLAKEKRKHTNNSGAIIKEKESREKPLLFDFIDHQSDVQILQRRGVSNDLGESGNINSNSNNDFNRNTNTGTLNGGDTNNTSLARQFEDNVPIQRDEAIHFGGIEETNGDNKYVDDELDFLVSAYSDEELHVEENKVIRTLNLDFDHNKETVLVDVSLTIPEGYPQTAALIVEASLSLASNNSSNEVIKVAMDALPGLVEVCRCEANGSVGGDNVLFTVIQTAEQWVHNEWSGIQAKYLPANAANGKSCLPTGGTASLDLCRMLISTHHIVDLEKIQFVKSTASKYDVGGYIKTGYPGYILVEGLEDNCTSLYETIVQQRTKFRKSRGKTDSATFSLAGKVMSTGLITEVDDGRLLPKSFLEIEQSREGMEVLEGFCDKVGLKKYIE